MPISKEKPPAGAVLGQKLGAARRFNNNIRPIRYGGFARSGL
jgi:hypothetical protein